MSIAEELTNAIVNNHKDVVYFLIDVRALYDIHQVLTHIKAISKDYKLAARYIQFIRSDRSTVKSLTDYDKLLELCVEYGYEHVFALMELINVFTNDKYSTVNINANNSYALRQSAAYGYYTIVQSLIKYGANVRAGNNDALKLSAENGHYDVVKLLIKHGADIHADKDYALTHSARRGHTNIVKLLVNSGADIHARNDYALRQSARKGYKDIVEFLIKRGANVKANNDLALIWSCREGHIDIVKLLIDNGADVTASDSYALECGVNRSDYDFVKLLLDKGGHKLDDAFEYCIDIQDVEMTKLLLKHGADINANDGYALITSVSECAFDMVKVLIEHGADIHAENDYALLLSINNADIEMVEYLMNNGANVYAENDSALKMATNAEYEDVVVLLASKYVEDGVPIPNECITKKISHANCLLINFVVPEQYELFNESIVKSVTLQTSAYKK